MKCNRCNRPLIRFALSVQTRGEVIGWGPDCARKVFKEQRKRRDKRQHGERDQMTVDWVDSMRAA